MQKLTIFTGYKGDKVKRTAKFNLGQNVFVIDWAKSRPILMDAYILYVGLEHPLQCDNFVYFINRGLPLEERKMYYENEIYGSRYVACRELAKQMRSHLTKLKEMMKHPYYKNSDQ